MKVFIFIMSTGILSINCYGQSFFNKALNAVEVKRSFENAVNRSSPAVMSFTMPGGGKNYYTINGGIAISPTILTTGKVPSRTAFDVFAVYNRNNQIDLEQNNFKAGLSIDQKLLFTKADGYTPANFKLGITFTNEYLHDKVDSVKSFLSLLYFTPIFRISDNIKLGMPVDNYKTQKLIPFIQWIPGIEYQNNFHVPATDKKGSLARLYMAASVDLFYRINKNIGNNKVLMNLLETGANYTYRNDFYNKTGIGEGYQPLFTYSLSIYPFTTNNVSFGATYLNGSDPVSGLSKQEYWLFEFMFKKDIK